MWRNNMGYNKPLADRVLIQEIGDAEKRSTGGIILAAANDQTRKGTVIAVGNGINDITGNQVPMEVKVGDTVAYNKNIATNINIDGENLVLLREAELLIILDRQTSIEKIWAEKDAIRAEQNAIIEAMSNTDGNSEKVRKQNKVAVDEIFPIEDTKNG